MPPRSRQRQIARSLKISTGVVAKYLLAAERAGLTSWPLPPEMDEVALARTLWPASDPPSATTPRLATLDFASIHTELKHTGVTRLLLWEEYAATHPEGYGYTEFCVLYREWRSRLKLSMRQTHRAGEKLFVDYCGPTVPVVNVATGEVRAAQVFVAVLGASSYTFAEATWTQSLPDWISSHVRAFTFFSGVPQLVIPDNREVRRDTRLSL